MIADLEGGESYALTRHHRRIGTIVPAVSSAKLIPPEIERASSNQHHRPTRTHHAATIDELLDDDKGPW